MIVEKKRYVVRIHDKEYALMSDDSQGHVFAAAQHVDRLLSSIAAQSSRVDIEKAAVLVALRLASDLLKLQLHVDGLAIRQETLVDLITQELITQ